jgi:hypothetical protein
MMTYVLRVRCVPPVYPKKLANIVSIKNAIETLLVALQIKMQRIR